MTWKIYSVLTNTEELFSMFFRLGQSFHGCCTVLLGVLNLWHSVGCSVYRWLLTSFQLPEALGWGSLEQSLYSSNRVGQVFFPFFLICVWRWGFCKDHIGKNEILANHVNLTDAGTQAWIHLNSDTRYSREGLKLVNGYFLSVRGTKPQGMP